MQLLMLALALVPQGPLATGSWLGEVDSPPPTPHAFVVAGPIELDPAAADEAALRQARADLRSRTLERGARVARQAAPFWLPAFLIDREIEAWERSIRSGRPLRVLEASRRQHPYSYGVSHQTTLLVADPLLSPSDSRHAPAAPDRELELERRLQRAGRLMLTKVGGIAALWGLLGFLYAWFDRLTRGYMTWRLRLLGIALGATAAPLVLLL